MGKRKFNEEGSINYYDISKQIIDYWNSNKILEISCLLFFLILSSNRFSSHRYLRLLIDIDLHKDVINCFLKLFVIQRICKKYVKNKLLFL